MAEKERLWEIRTEGNRQIDRKKWTETETETKGNRIERDGKRQTKRQGQRERLCEIKTEGNRQR